MSVHPTPVNQKGITMTKALVKIQTRLRSEEGATAVEYGLLVALIAAVIVAVVALLGIQISEAFQTIVTELN